MRILLLPFLGLAFSVSAFGATSVERDLSGLFGGREGCFVLYDVRADQYLRYNPKGCAQQFTPCSTFKIAHSLIALDTGVIPGPDYSLPWDGVKRPIASWNSDHTMRSALSNSVVWYYQEIARRIGPVRMADYLGRLDYGNRDVSGGPTNFWLESSLLLSADQQVAFLRRLWASSLPISQGAQRTTREVLELTHSDDGRVLYGKTGTAGDAKADVARLGWFVGCVTKGERTVLFATRIAGERDASGRQARTIAEAILERLKI